MATLVESATSPVAVAIGLATLVGALISVLHTSSLGTLEAMVKSEYVRTYVREVARGGRRRAGNLVRELAT